MSGEVWKPIPNWEEYEVSDQGQVRRRIPSRFANYCSHSRGAPGHAQEE